MEFKLVDTQQPDENNDDDDEVLSSEDDDYNDICKNKRQPIINSVDKKRDNKTVECPKCHRKMNNKTYKYSHKCSIAKANESAPKEMAIPTKQDIHTMIQEQERVRRQFLIQQKQEKMNKLLSRAF